MTKAMPKASSVYVVVGEVTVTTSGLPSKSKAVVGAQPACDIKYKDR